MIPSHYDITVTEAAQQPSNTYGVDPITKRIHGRVDGLNAMLQAVTKMLDTERFAYVIYNDQYGIEFETLFGQSPDYVKSVLEYRLRDALIADDRFIDLQNFKISGMTDDSITFSATIICSYGTFNIDTGVI